MLRKGLSARVVRHLERGEELMDLNRTAFKRNEAAFDRNTQAFERLMAGFDRLEKRAEKHEIFIRDMNRRNEIVIQKVIADHEQFMAKLMERDKEADQRSDQLMADLRDLREESRAQRRALLALIDRLPPPAQAA